MGKIEERLYAAVCLVLWTVYWLIPPVALLVAGFAAFDLITK